MKEAYCILPAQVPTLRPSDLTLLQPQLKCRTLFYEPLLFWISLKTKVCKIKYIYIHIYNPSLSNSKKSQSNLEEINLKKQNHQQESTFWSSIVKLVSASTY